MILDGEDMARLMGFSLVVDILIIAAVFIIARSRRS